MIQIPNGRQSGPGDDRSSLAAERDERKDEHANITCHRLSYQIGLMLVFLELLCKVGGARIIWNDVGIPPSSMMFRPSDTALTIFGVDSGVK